MIKLLPHDFPPVLREIPQPPEFLYLEGELPDPEEFVYLAVVGSRRYSNYGREACESLIAGLAGHPICICSGLALGIDSIAHRTALDVGLPTVAIPGSGLDRSVIYPATNRTLADDIVRAGGALLSEHEPDHKAFPFDFPSRNRIMAGLTHATLVIEAADKSGTLITARLALDYNRDVLVVPGSIFSPVSEGCNRLIRFGATPVTSSNDILDALDLMPGEQKTLPLDDLPDIERRAIEILSAPMSRDDFYSELDLSASDGAILVATLEIKGFIAESAGELHRVM